VTSGGSSGRWATRKKKKKNKKEKKENDLVLEIVHGNNKLSLSNS